MFLRSQRFLAGEVMIEECWRDECKIHKGAIMSSGKYRRHDGHNPVQIKDGKVVRLRKNGTVKAILGTLADMKRNKK